MTREFHECVVEFDPDRGVLYIHSGMTGSTLVRMCGLPIGYKVPDNVYGDMLDITITGDCLATRRSPTRYPAAGKEGDRGQK
jgi:hypothetical protein